MELYLMAYQDNWPCLFYDLRLTALLQTSNIMINLLIMNLLPLICNEKLSLHVHKLEQFPLSK